MDIDAQGDRDRRGRVLVRGDEQGGDGRVGRVDDDALVGVGAATAHGRVVGVAVVGGDPDVGARLCGREVTGRRGAVAQSDRPACEDRGDADRVLRIDHRAVELERDGAGRIVAARDRCGVVDLAADDHAGRGLRRDLRGDLVDDVVLAIVVALACDCGVLGVAAVAGDPAVRAGGGRGERHGSVDGRSARDRLGRAEGRCARAIGAGAKCVEGDGAGRVAGQAGQARRVADGRTDIDDIRSAGRDGRLVLRERHCLVAARVRRGLVVGVARVRRDDPVGPDIGDGERLRVRDRACGNRDGAAVDLMRAARVVVQVVDHVACRLVARVHAAERRAVNEGRGRA